MDKELRLGPTTSRTLMSEALWGLGRSILLEDGGRSAAFVDNVVLSLIVTAEADRFTGSRDEVVVGGGRAG